MVGTISFIRGTRARVQSQRRHALQDQIARVANRRTLLLQVRNITAVFASVGTVAWTTVGGPGGSDFVVVMNQGGGRKKNEQQELGDDKGARTSIGVMASTSMMTLVMVMETTTAVAV